MEGTVYSESIPGICGTDIYVIILSLVYSAEDFCTSFCI